MSDLHQESSAQLPQEHLQVQQQHSNSHGDANNDIHSNGHHAQSHLELTENHPNHQSNGHHQRQGSNGAAGHGTSQEEVIQIQEQQQRMHSLQQSPERNYQSNGQHQMGNGHHLSPIQDEIHQSHQRTSSQGSARNNKHRGDFPPGFVLDELTEYAMAKEGIDIEDLVQRPFEEFLKECSGNQKLAQMRYDYKEAERQGMLQDIENRKKFIAMDMGGHHQQQFADSTYKTLSPNASSQMLFNTGVSQEQFYSTQQFANPKNLSRLSQSQSHAQLMNNGLHSLKASGKRLMPITPSSGSGAVDNKIFENMLRNQIEQEIKLRSIQERQEMFLIKSHQMQEKRQREILKKQELMAQKQQLKEEKLRKQEEAQRQWQQETLAKLKMKSELTEQRQLKYKYDLKSKMHEKELKKEAKKQYAQEQYNKYLQELENKQMEVQVKTSQFQKKLDERARQQQMLSMTKKAKKDQVLASVQEMRYQEEQRKLQLAQQAQLLELAKEKRVEDEKRKQTQIRIKKGVMKSEKISEKVEDAYRKMQEWTNELERREKLAADNLKKQQKLLQEQMQIKSEMKRLKQESAHLKQKRKEAKEKLKKEEQLQKFQGIVTKVERFKEMRSQEKWRKQQEIFKAEQKRADMKTAFYHMAVWNVQEAGDLIKEILEENDKSAGHGVKPKSVAEKVREKAAKIRRDERLGLSKMGGYNGMGQIEEEQMYEGEQMQYTEQNHHEMADRAQSSQQRVRGIRQEQVVVDKRLQQHAQ